MADVTAEFFATLARRGYEPWLKGLTGSCRFDVTGVRAEHWLVAVEQGDITVSRRTTKADAVMRADRKVLDAITSGKQNALAATLRGAAVIEGDVGLLAGFQRLFPGPPRENANAHAAGRGKRKS